MKAFPALLAVAALAGCGDTPDRLVVSAAASLTEPLRECGRAFGLKHGVDVRLSFAGSDELAAQIRRGVRPDLYAAANMEVPEALAREGLVEEPEDFATNELVIAVQKSSDIKSVDDLARDGVKLAVGTPTVPAGAYAREVLDGIGAAFKRRVLANVRTEEPDVKGIVAKVAQGAADAGFVYRTDVLAAGDRLRAVQLRGEPAVTYGAAVVRGAGRHALAEEFLHGMIEGRCADSLSDAGFGPRDVS